MRIGRLTQHSQIDHFTILAFLLLLSGCAVIEQMRCAPHSETKVKPFPENHLTECLSTNTFWASHPVFCIGADSTKPPVLLLHELPGLSSKTLDYAQALSSDFSVYVPLLYGTPNQSSALKGALATRLNGEWTAQPDLEGNSRIIKWLQHVTTRVRERHPGQSIGIIGNCLTGAIPLALLDNKAVNAVVLAQPALPLPFFYYSDEDESSLGISEHAKEQAVSRKDAWIYYLHFETDCVSKRAKKTTLATLFPKQFIDGEILKAEYAPRCQEEVPNVHSTLIGEYDAGGLTSRSSQDRRNRVRQFLKDPRSLSQKSEPASCR
jgi:dienelactone hydrolase